MSWELLLKEDYIEEDMFGLIELGEIIQKYYENRESVLPQEHHEEIRKFVAKYMEMLT